MAESSDLPAMTTNAANLELPKQETEEPSWEDQIPTELAVDNNWHDSYPTSNSSGSNYDSDTADFESRNTKVDTLQDHLLWQLNLTPMSEKDATIAFSIIDAIDPNGMLTVEIESLHVSFEDELEIELDEVVAVLHRIQQFDPIGVGYRDLAECLLIQLNQYGNPEQKKNIEK